MLARHSMLMALALLAGVVVTPAGAQICGDADQSGGVTVTDGVRALGAAAGLGDCTPAAVCDLDGNGAVTVSDGVNVLRVAAGLPTFVACPVAPALALTPIATGLTAPLFVSGAPGEPAGRLFVVEQPGTIRVLDDGDVRGTPFLDVTGITSKGGEQGLLGLAFHPQYASNRRFFVFYTDSAGDNVIAEYRRSAGSAVVAEPGAVRIVRSIADFAANHNGGMLAFGSDGFLYAATGDGGGGGDPQGNGQDRQAKLGKILRLDVDGDAPPPGNLPNADPDVWDFGLRNPFRFSFDRATGDLYIGDVGQGDFEEVDVEPRGQGNRNYGWNVTEGFACFSPRNDCDTAGITFPVVVHSHDDGDCSVIGGYVYRGSAIPGLVGRYLYGDLCTNRIRSFVWDGGGAASRLDLTDALASNTTLNATASFGEDLNGELYVCDLSGTVYRIDPR